MFCDGRSSANALERLFPWKVLWWKTTFVSCYAKGHGQNIGSIFSFFKHSISVKQTCIILIIIQKLFALDSSVLQISTKLLVIKRLIWISDSFFEDFLSDRRRQKRENVHVQLRLIWLAWFKILEFRSNLIISMRRVSLNTYKSTLVLFKYSIYVFIQRYKLPLDLWRILSRSMLDWNCLTKRDILV